MTSLSALGCAFEYLSTTIRRPTYWLKMENAFQVESALLGYLKNE